MDKEQFSRLFGQYIKESIGNQDLDRLMESLQDRQIGPDWEQAVLALLNDDQLRGLSDRESMQAVFQRIMQGEQIIQSKRTMQDNESAGRGIPSGEAFTLTQSRAKRLYLPGWIAAAILLLLLGTAAYFGIWKRQDHHSSPVIASARQVDFAPGKQRATLTLGNGAIIALDSASTGLITLQGASKIIKQDSGTLSYQRNNEERNNEDKPRDGEEPVYNIVSTPRGGQFRITLPDGTNVWLNAASSLRFPASFTGSTRMVEMTGEAYFEVAHRATMPFVVRSRGQEVRVLGTQFNINAYADEAGVRTTLVDGSISLGTSMRAGGQIILTPGQQARLTSEGEVDVIKDADVDAAISWKTGFFSFRGADVRSVMRQLSRWYDVDISYQGEPAADETFGGEIDRNLPLSEMLAGLKLTRIHYRIEADRKLVILP